MPLTLDLGLCLLWFRCHCPKAYCVPSTRLDATQGTYTEQGRERFLVFYAYLYVFIHYSTFHHRSYLKLFKTVVKYCTEN